MVQNGAWSDARIYHHHFRAPSAMIPTQPIISAFYTTRVRGTLGASGAPTGGYRLYKLILYFFAALAAE
jgi:hypothetical protein